MEPDLRLELQAMDWDWGVLLEKAPSPCPWRNKATILMDPVAVDA